MIDHSSDLVNNCPSLKMKQAKCGSFLTLVDFPIYKKFIRAFTSARHRFLKRKWSIESLKRSSSQILSFKLPYFAVCKSSCRSQDKNQEGGKSGQHRAPYFLTGRLMTGDGHGTESATENKPPLDAGLALIPSRGKGEKVE